ncbi:cGMP-dependent protein kinase 1-like isoform X2 [Corticium candelabrum]|nr:cGMP-dependent protein kinase 1-like isoform X2 [Corticium candelabrum]XP_062523263.1 cGMP-dependent protein kinase 1-like isoform X2 [Corticium candelabrum]
MADCMSMKEFEQDEYIIRQGSAGIELYVIEEGLVEVIKGDEKIDTMGPGIVFGELAILYDCERTAHVKALTHTKVWALSRRTYQVIMQKSNMDRQQEYSRFLKSCELFQSFPDSRVTRIADALEEDHYNNGDYIIRQGGNGDTFYIIQRGEVSVTRKADGDTNAREVRVMKGGEYFGEKALLGEEKRTANVIAKGSVSCLTLDRSDFNKYIGKLETLQKYKDEEFSNLSSDFTVADEFKALTLDDLDVIATLGVGGFGRVDLVTVKGKMKNGEKCAYALKRLKKQHVVETRQQEHVFNEKKIMMTSQSQFITKLYRTFRDSKYLYMLMEACLGGELWTLLRDKGNFDDATTRFYTGCVVEAFEYLHGLGIIYRDLKPENLLLDRQGFAKLVDFGFAKRIGKKKTWTFCGTPEYVAPEIILNKGHDFSADLWSLGILMFELLTGSPPFQGSDPLKTYNIILKGMDMIEFPRRFPRNAFALIKRVCRESPVDRLGNQKDGMKDIKKHKWFQGFDWDGLVNRTIQPPIIPEVKDSTDTNMFDHYPDEEPNTIPPDDLTGWDKEF